MQVVWWGHPDTTASLALDHFFGLDDETVSAASQYGAEQLVRLEHLNTARYSPNPAPSLDEEPYSLGNGDDCGPSTMQGRVGEREDTLETFGLAWNRFFETFAFPGQSCARSTRIFLVLGRLFKLHPDFDVIILRLLAAAPHAVVALITERQEIWTSDVWARLSAAAQTTGTLEALKRVRFVNHWNYIRVLRLPETVAVLDTWPYGGCLTALEAMSHSRPVITLPSPFSRGRFALSMYRQMGLAPLTTSHYRHSFAPESSIVAGNPASTAVSGGFPWGLVASDPDNLIAAAVSLASDAAHRRRLRALVTEGYASSLHRNADAAHEWARAIRGLHAQTLGA